jgi:hypothetical protein
MIRSTLRFKWTNKYSHFVKWAYFDCNDKNQLSDEKLNIQYPLLNLKYQK